MFGIISQILTAFGLASASGLNAYIPLLVVALAARFTPLVKLNPPFDIITNEWVIGTLVVLLAIETVVDKIPGADTINDIFQTVVRPSAGALLFAASTNAANLHPVAAAILGLVLAFGVHSVKAAARPVVTVGTAGIGNPVVSVAEDVASLIISLLAILAPVVAVLLFLLLFYFLIRRLGSRRRHITTINS